MSNLFGVDIAGIVDQSIADHLLPATLTRQVSGEYNPVTDRYEDENGDPVDPGSFDYQTRGFVDRFSDEMIASGHATESERMIVLIAKRLSITPKIGDQVTIESETYTVSGVPQRDPAQATWTIRAEVA